VATLLPDSRESKLEDSQFCEFSKLRVGSTPLKCCADPDSWAI